MICIFWAYSFIKQVRGWPVSSVVHNAMYVITGASPSESHIVEFAMEFLIYTYFVRRAVSHFRILFCTFLHHLLIQKLFTNYFYSTQQEDINHLATARTETTCGPTYVFNGSNDRCYRMAKRFHLSMPLFVLPLTVEVTLYMDRPLQWPHRWGLSHIIKDCESATSV